MKKILFLILLAIFLVGCTEEEFRQKYEQEIKEELKNTIREAIFAESDIDIPLSLEPDLSKFSSKAKRISLKDKGAFNPSIYGNYIAFESGLTPKNQNKDIYLYNILTEEITRITSDPSEQYEPKVYEDKIYWKDKRFGGVSYFVYDITTKETKQIDEIPTYIYWDVNIKSENRNGIKNYDIFLNDEPLIETEVTSELMPVKYHNLLVYLKVSYDSWPDVADIYVYDLNTKQEMQISFDGFRNKDSVGIYENKIVWRGCDNSQCYTESNSVYLYIYGAESAETISRIVDGDTFELLTGDKVRLIGIDTPEKGEEYYLEAKNRLQELLSGKNIRLVKDVSETDRYGRLLRYVYVDDKFVNEILVKEGLAEAKEYKPDTKYSLQLKQAEVEAKAKESGIWSK